MSLYEESLSRMTLYFSIIYFSMILREFFPYYGETSFKVIIFSKRFPDSNEAVDTLMDAFFVTLLVGILISTACCCNNKGSIKEHTSSYRAFIFIFLKNLIVSSKPCPSFDIFMVCKGYCMLVASSAKHYFSLFLAFRIK